MNAFRCVACEDIPPRLSEKGRSPLTATSIHKSSYFGPWQKGVKIKTKAKNKEPHPKTQKTKQQTKNEARFVFLEIRAACKNARLIALRSHHRPHQQLAEPLFLRCAAK